MKVLLVHNRYLQPGGEDTVFGAESELLRSRGHDVIEFVEDNRGLDEIGRPRMAIEAIWSRSTQKKLCVVLRQAKPHVAHFHNTFLRISPAAYYSVKQEGVPVVQSMHNPRLMCPSANFWRNGDTCISCLGKNFAWPGIVHSCYHGSKSATSLVAFMTAFHRALGTWQRKVDVYVTFTDFYRQLFIRGGLPRDKIVVKPHHVHPDPGGDEERSVGDYALFIGRLDPEKGVHTLLRAWKHLGHIPLRIRGDGRLQGWVSKQIALYKMKGVEVVGRLPRANLLSLIRHSRFLVWPSEGFYETFGLVAIEAFACGLPVITSGLGAMAEIVEDRRTGLHFEPGNAEDLAAKIEWAWTHPGEMSEMGRRARQEYERKHTADRNYKMLMDIYRGAINRVQGEAG